MAAIISTSNHVLSFTDTTGGWRIPGQDIRAVRIDPRRSAGVAPDYWEVSTYAASRPEPYSFDLRTMPQDEDGKETGWANDRNGATRAANTILEIAGVPSSALVADGNYGDIAVTESGTVWTINNGVVTAVMIDSETSSSGDVLTSDGAGGASWQPAGGGSGITQLNGDGSAGPGSGLQTFTLATVNAGVGTFGSATQAPVLTANGKGLITAVSQTTITPAVSSITGLGAGVSTFLATPSSANLAAALTDETGSGSAVFATSPTLVTPDLGTPSAGTLTNCTGLPPSTGLTSPYGAWMVAAYNTGVPICVYGTSNTLNNQPSAATLFNPALGGPRLDTTGFVSVKFQIVVSTGSASANNPKAILRYFTAYSNTASSYLDIGTSEVSCSLTNTGVIETSWIPLAAGAIGTDKYIRIVYSGGNGSLSPVTGIATMFLR